MRKLAAERYVQPSETDPALVLEQYNSLLTGPLMTIERPDGAVISVIDKEGRAAGAASTLMPDGAIAETWPRAGIGMGTRSALSSGRVSVAAVYLDDGVTISQIAFWAASTALATGTTQIFGLYDQNLNLLAKTVDDGATAWAATSKKTLALTAPFVTTYSGLYYVAILVAAATVPTLLGGSFTSTNIAADPPMLCGTHGVGLVDLPDPLPGLSGTIYMPYAVLL